MIGHFPPGALTGYGGGAAHAGRSDPVGRLRTCDGDARTDEGAVAFRERAADAIARNDP